MKLITTEVTSRVDGEKANAEVVVCDVCGNDTFNVFYAAHEAGEQMHVHLQCTVCGETGCNESYKLEP